MKLDNQAVSGDFKYSSHHQNDDESMNPGFEPKNNVVCVASVTYLIFLSLVMISFSLLVLTRRNSLVYSKLNKRYLRGSSFTLASAFVPKLQLLLYSTQNSDSQDIVDTGYYHSH